MVLLTGKSISANQISQFNYVYEQHREKERTNYDKLLAKNNLISQGLRMNLVQYSTEKGKSSNNISPAAITVIVMGDF